MREEARREVVTHYLDRALWLAQRDRFEEARQELEQALTFAESSPVQVERIRDVKEKIRDLHKQRVQGLSQVVEDVLKLQPMKVSQEYRASADHALETLKSIASGDVVQTLHQRWEEHHQKAVKARSRRFRRLTNQACALVEQKQFDEAQDMLQKAQETADEKEQIETVREIEEETRKRRQIYEDLLTKELERLFAKGPEGLSQMDLERGEVILADLTACKIDRFKLELLSDRWQAYGRHREMLLSLHSTRQQLERLWDSPYILLDQYEEALALARHASEAYPNEQRFMELVQEAETRRNQGRRKFETLVAQASAGNFRDVLDELEHMYQDGCEQLPHFEWENEGLKPVENVLAQEAIDLLLKLAQEYAVRKAEEYKESAVNVLASDPKGAASQIERALSLEFLPPAEREELQAYYSEVIVSALEQQKLALQLLAEAKERRAEDLEVAWDLVMEASCVAPDLDEVNKTRKYLSPWLKVHWSTLLRKAEEKLWNDDVEMGRRLADRVLSRTEDLSSFKDVYQRAQQIVSRCGEKAQVPGGNDK